MGREKHRSGRARPQAVMAITSLARVVEPARFRMVALGALPRLARIRDGTVRVNKHFGSTAQRLHKLLVDAVQKKAAKDKDRKGGCVVMA